MNNVHTLELVNSVEGDRREKRPKKQVDGSSILQSHKCDVDDKRLTTLRSIAPQHGV
jgi:hypothetical protein